MIAMNEKYVLWELDNKATVYRRLDDLEGPTGVKAFELDGDTPLADRWTSPGTGALIDGNPKTPLVPDCLTHTGWLVVSARLRQALEAHGVSHVEYLPIDLRVKGASIGLPYFVVHFLDRPACLDIEASGADFDLIDETEIDTVKRLVFSSDPERPLFQIAHFNRVFITSIALAEALAKDAYSGIRWLPLDTHPDWSGVDKTSSHWKRVEALYTRHYEHGKPQSFTLVAKPKAKAKRADAKQVKAWLTAIPNAGRFEKGRWSEAFHPGEDETWLDAYEDSPDDWPTFERERYRAFGFNDRGDHWLLDLDAGGAVVYFSHERGYGEDDFEVIAPSLEDFAAMVKPGG